jgi:hypothetical protein
MPLNYLSPRFIKATKRAIARHLYNEVERSRQFTSAWEKLFRAAEMRSDLERWDDDGGGPR